VGAHDGYLYDSFGNTLLSSGPTANNFRFVGRLGYELDADLNNYYLRARVYTPTAGRFIARDPVVFDGQLVFPAYTPYAYADANPANVVDPNGLYSVPIILPPLRIITPSPNDKGCTGICIQGHGAKPGKCNITKLAVEPGSDRLCKTAISPTRICDGLTDRISKLNVKFPLPGGWRLSYCGQGCVCSAKGAAEVPAPQTILLSDYTITQTGPIGVGPLKTTLTCVVTVSGTIQVTGGTVALLPCCKARPAGTE
jgi:RHS repeat-associated protein